MLVTLVRDVRASVPAVHPVERAAVFHVRFEQIHPFEDGNGPLGRLAMNLLLHQSGYPMLNIRFSKRRSYFHALERANETGNLRPFVLWFCRRYARALHWCRL
jgi:Fic family protein